MCPGLHDLFARAQQIFVLIAVIYYNKRYKAKSAKGQTHEAKSRENQEQVSW